jgi:hypothetical protein
MGLPHPRIFFGGLAKNRNVVQIFSEYRIVSFLDLVDLVAFHDLLNLLVASRA